MEETTDGCKVTGCKSSCQQKSPDNLFMGYGAERLVEYLYTNRLRISPVGKFVLATKSRCQLLS